MSRVRFSRNLMFVVILGLLTASSACAQEDKELDVTWESVGFTEEQLLATFCELCRELDPNPLRKPAYSVSGLLAVEDFLALGVPREAAIRELARMGVMRDGSCTLGTVVEQTKWGDGELKLPRTTVRFQTRIAEYRYVPAGPKEATRITLEVKDASEDPRYAPYRATLVDFLEFPKFRESTPKGGCVAALQGMAMPLILDSHQVWELILQLKPKTEVDCLACAYVADVVFRDEPNKWWEDGYTYHPRTKSEETLNRWAFSHFASNEVVSKTRSAQLYCLLNGLPYTGRPLLENSRGVLLTYEQAADYRSVVSDPKYKGFLEAGHAEYFSIESVAERAKKRSQESTNRDPGLQTHNVPKSTALDGVEADSSNSGENDISIGDWTFWSLMGVGLLTLGVFVLYFRRQRSLRQ